LTLAFGPVATNSAPSSGLTAGPAPFPAFNRTIAGSFAGLEGAVAGAKAADGISTVSTALIAQNPKETSPVAKAADLVASPGGSATVSPSLIGTTVSGGLSSGLNGNPGVGANVSTIVAPATIANPAPNSIFLDPDQVFGKLETITVDPFPGSRPLPDSTLLDDVGVSAPAEGTGNAGGEGDIDFDAEAFAVDQTVSVSFTDTTMIRDGAATGSATLAAEADAQVTTTDAVLPIDRTHGGIDESSAGELVVITTAMLATYSANLALGGATWNFGTTPWAARGWPTTRRGSERLHPEGGRRPSREGM
jgi:hypothetical protein